VCLFVNFLGIVIMIGEPTHTTPNVRNGTKHPSFIIVSVTLLLKLSFNPLHSRTNQQLFEKHLCNQSHHYEKYRWFLLQIEVTNGGHHMPATKSACFTVSKDEWDTKENTGKSIKMHSLWQFKASLRLKQHWTTTKSQAPSFSHCRVMLIWRHQMV